MLPAALNATLPYGWPVKFLLAMTKLPLITSPLSFLMYVTICFVAEDVMYIVPEESNAMPDGNATAAPG